MKQRMFLCSDRRPFLPTAAALTFAAAIPLCVLAGLVGAGCGGGGSSSIEAPATTETRQVAIEVAWPERGRAEETPAATSIDAPAAALSLLVTLKGARPDGSDLSFTVNRGDNTAAFRQTYVSPTPAKAGEWELEVHCHADPDAAGEEVGLALAHARVEAHSNDNGVAPAVLARLEMRARIVRVVVQPEQSVNVGERKELRFAGYDAEGNIVPVTHASALFEVVEGGDFLRVVNRHLVEGVAAGVAQVRVKVGDAVSDPAAVRVVAPVVQEVGLAIRPERLELFTGQSETFAATVTGADNKAVEWSIREGSPTGGTITDGGRYTAPQTPGEYHVVATSKADPAKKATAVVIVRQQPETVDERVRKVTLATNDLVWDSGTQRIWASVPDRAGAPRAGSVTALDPTTGAIGDSFRVGSNPNKLARPASGDSRALWVGVDGERSLRRFDLASKTPGQFFSLGQEEGRGRFIAEDIEVMPGAPETVAVARRNVEGSPRHEGVVVYDSGAPRSLKTPGGVVGSNALAFGAAAGKLYGINNETNEFGYRRMEIGAQGVQIVSTHGDVFAGLGADIKYDDGRLYHTSGRVIRPDTREVLGTFPEIGEGALVLPDVARGYVYFLTGSGETRQLRIFDRNSYQQRGRIEVRGVLGKPSGLIRWGEAGVAFRTNEDQVFLIRSVTP